RAGRQHAARGAGQDAVRDEALGRRHPEGQHQAAVSLRVRVFYGWWVVAACFVIAAFAWGLGLFGSSVYLQAVTSTYGWPVAEVALAITLFFLVSAAIQRIVGGSIDRWG